MHQFIQIGDDWYAVVLTSDGLGRFTAQYGKLAEVPDFALYPFFWGKSVAEVLVEAVAEVKRLVEGEPEPEPTNTCRVCHADLSREEHDRWCESAAACEDCGGPVTNGARVCANCGAERDYQHGIGEEW